MITGYDRNVFVVPVLHYVFDSLYDAGVRRFFFVVGRGKRVVEDYFTPDWEFINFLERNGKEGLAKILKRFYEKIESCDFVMVNQPFPRGFGDAVLRVKPFMTDDAFIVHAGDDIVYPNHAGEVARLVDHYVRFKPGAVFLYDVSPHPERYGVVTGEEKGDFIQVEDIVEKPSRPPSNYVVVAIYVFERGLFNALEETKPSSGEHQLTDAIRYMLKRGEKVHAVRVRGKRLDLGTPDSYLYALKTMVDKIGVDF